MLAIASFVIQHAEGGFFRLKALGHSDFGFRNARPYFDTVIHSSVDRLAQEDPDTLITVSYSRLRAR
jgi:hypothetical protein